METTQKDPIRLVASQAFQLAPEEMRSLYVALALNQYRYLRSPGYSEPLLLKMFADDLKKFLGEMTRVADRSGNHMHQRIRMFFDLHHNLLRRIVEQEQDQQQQGMPQAVSQAVAEQM